MGAKTELFEKLVNDHGREVYAYLWRMLQDPAAAEDCLQESFLKAFVAFDRLDSDANRRAWLYKIASNTALTYLRRNGRVINWDFDDRASEAPSVEDQAEQGLLLDQVRSAVETLPEKQRMSLVLRNYQGLSYREVGRALDITESAARANVYQARAKLRRHFADSVRVEDP